MYFIGDIMYQKLSDIGSRLGKYILPFLLTFVLNSSILGVFSAGMLSAYSLISAVIILAMFLFFGFLQKHRIIGGIIYVFLGLFALYLMMRFVFRYDWGEGFSQWFLTGGTEGTAQPEYFYALVSVFPFFLSSVVYYFSVVLYRTFFLMLASLVPCAVYVKVLSDMSSFYLVLIVGLNAALYCMNAHNTESDSSKDIKKARSLSVLMITAASMLIASLIPKQGDAIFYDKFELVFMNAGSGNDGKYNLLGTRSGSAEDYRNLRNTPLYDLYSETLVYLRRQSFDLYDIENHCWYPLEKYSAPTDNDVDTLLSVNGTANYEDMLKAVKLAASLDSSFSEIVPPAMLSLDRTGEEQSELILIPIDFNANYVPAPIRASSVTPNDGAVLSATLHKQLMSENGDMLKSSVYHMTYMKEFSSRNIWLENGGADFTDSSYSEFLDKLSEILNDSNADEKLINTVNAFRSEYDMAMEYKSDYGFNNSDIPESLAQLAAELTADCTYDWQKASALQDYFQSGEFQYDITYTPPRGMNTAEYFVFTSKKGTCSDFATAYTLMARSVGLTVRYTEGYSPDITSEANHYRVRTSGSHAYPEVYIQNAGWLVFEPTVASMYSMSFGDEVRTNTNNGPDIDTELLLNVLLVICGISAAAAIVIFSIPAAKHLSDDIKIGRGGSQAVLLIYRRMGEIYGKKFRCSAASMTPAELEAEINNRLGLDISRFTELYESVCFGGSAPDENDSEYAKELYKTFRKTINNRKEK